MSLLRINNQLDPAEVGAELDLDIDCHGFSNILVLNPIQRLARLGLIGSFFLSDINQITQIKNVVEGRSVADSLVINSISWICLSRGSRCRLSSNSCG